MAGTCVEKIDCPRCGGTDTLQVFEQGDGETNGYCFKCQTPFDPEETSAALDGREPKKAIDLPEEYIKQQLQEIMECPIKALPSRGLREDTASYFKVRTGLSEADGKTPETWHFPLTKNNGTELAGYQTRIIETKQTFNTRGVGGCDLAGWRQALKRGGKTLYITEGMLDMMTVHQVLTDNAKRNGYSPEAFSVVSLPLGAMSAKKYISQHTKDIERLFKEVKIVFDQDEAGKKAQKEATLALEGIACDVYVCTLTYKDANDALRAKDEQALIKALLFNTEKAETSSILNSDDLWEKAKERPVVGEPWPWDGLTRLTKGLRGGETWYFGGAPKMGKSVVVDQLGAWFVTQGDAPVYFCKPEEQPHHTLQRLAGKAIGKVFHDPDIPWDADAFERGKNAIGNKAFFEDVYAMAKWDDVKKSIRRLAHQKGTTKFFIDPLTTFTSHLSASEANEELQRIASELAALMKEIGGTAFIFCHLKAKGQGRSHSMGGRVLSDEFAGSRAMSRYCHGMIGLEGNKDPDLPKGARDLRDLVLLEDRNFGQTGRVHLRYSHSTGMLTEITEDEHVKIKEGLLDEEE